MHVTSISWILMLVIIPEVSLQDIDYNYEDQAEEEQLPPLCSITDVSIKGGRVSFSQGGQKGSVLTYHCDPGQYPFPVSYRTCEVYGEWSPMRLSNGRLVSRATCKAILCPAQLQLDHGEFFPRDQWFSVGEMQSFSCEEGFTLYGSAQRNCTLSGTWTGSSPVCVSHDPTDDCDDPGVPPGAQRTSGLFHLGEKVTYQCQAGLDLLGSAERICLENREWSGTTPRCYGPNTFDSPSSVASAMTGSLAGAMDVLSPDFKKKEIDDSFGRSFYMDDGRMHVYILIDTSGSIEKAGFELLRTATVALIKKLDSYEAQLNFHVLSFATNVIDIVKITEKDTSGSAEEVIDALMGFDYNRHGHKTGTNLYAALQRVQEMISIFKLNRHNNYFNDTQNIIIIETDGYSNTGNRPLTALRRIRALLDYSPTALDHTEEKRLDVYVFGVGKDVNKVELNSLASKKRGEDHVFVLKNLEMLGRVFNSIISDKSVTMCGIAQEHVTKKDLRAYTEPWHVTLKSPQWGSRKDCRGSIVSKNWVLTAAHCFARQSTAPVQAQIDVDYGEGRVKVAKVIMHPNYNIHALRSRNVSEFYDYDVALVQVNESIPLSRAARPICLPCTIPATRAMKKFNSTCDEHRKVLLAHKPTPAFFIDENKEHKETYIHTGSERALCVEEARQLLVPPTDITLDEFVTERFLCSGGTTGLKHTITCKGDSGGSLFLQKNKRFFQVGVVSWGNINVCSSSSGLGGFSPSNPPKDARDFHINVFKIMPWLKKHLGSDITFLPDVQ